MSDEIVFDVLCAKVLDALRALGLGKFSIRNYYYEGMWPIIKVYRSEGVIFYSAAFTNEIVNRFHLDHENGLVADRIWAKVRKASILFEEYVQTGKIVWKRVRPDPKISLAPYYHELLRRFCQHEANMPESLFHRVEQYVEAHNGVSKRVFVVGLVAQELQSWLMEQSPDEVQDQEFGPDQDEQGFGMSMTM